MAKYKRNQVEEAISRSVDSGSAKPSSELRTRLKRLLDTDRSLGRAARSADPKLANYAFYSGDSPGRGVEVRFSDYEAFALLTGLRLLEHGWPQGFAVRLLRHVRPELEAQHARILKQDPGSLFDKDAIRQNARPGDIAVDNTDPVFLTITSREERDKSERTVSGAVCRGTEQVFKFVKQQAARSWSLFELVMPAHALRRALSKAKPRKRGRSG